tara:strand:+ start:1251 stop:1457 length:207 start_codon:yes stop_codon:yes gene_type:complete
MHSYWVDYALMISSGQVALISFTHFHTTSREVFLPSSGNRRCNVIATGKFFRESRLEPGVDYDRRRIR